MLDILKIIVGVFAIAGSVMLGVMLSGYVHRLASPRLAFKPFTCRQCLSFWIAVLAACVFTLGLGYPWYGVVSLPWVAGFFAYQYNKPNLIP